MNLPGSGLLLRRPVTSLGHQGGEEFSESGPIFLNYVQKFSTIPNTFLQGRQNIL